MASLLNGPAWRPGDAVDDDFAVALATSWPSQPCGGALARTGVTADRRTRSRSNPSALFHQSGRAALSVEPHLEPIDLISLKSTMVDRSM